MHQTYDVLIVGCGMAGIGASHILSQHNIKHIMLESRGRIGGRIFSQELDGVSVDMGAMTVHHPFQNNPIKDIMDQIGWKSYNKKYDSKQIMIGPDKEIDQQTKEQSYEVYASILKQLSKRGQESEVDISFGQAMAPFLEEQQAKHSEKVINFVKVLLKIHGNIQGAELQDISARWLYVDDQSDVIPQGGYSKLLKAIFDMHSRQVKTGEKVVSINYASDIVEVKTQDNTFYAKKVISSLPLGVLKNKSVAFWPELTQQRLKAIDNLSISIFNKIQVSFKQPFWDITKQYILLASNSGEKCYRIRSILESGKYILCGFVSGRASEELTKLSDEEILEDFLSCLKRYYTKAEIEVSSFLVTRWNTDEHSLGSYSYYHVGRTTIDDVIELRRPISDRLWFVGEHCSLQMLACAHGAFGSGVSAAKEVLTFLQAK